MKGLLVRRLIDARGRIFDASAKVLHMAENMTLAVLRYRLAEIGTDAEKGSRGLLDRIAVDRYATNDHEASAPQ